MMTLQKKTLILHIKDIAERIEMSINPQFTYLF